MKVYSPLGEPLIQTQNLAKRPDSLEGKTVGFWDGWGHRKENGEFGMYPLMEIMKERLEREYGTRTIWLRKPNVAQVAPKEQLDYLVTHADVVINGECA